MQWCIISIVLHCYIKKQKYANDDRFVCVAYSNMLQHALTITFTRPLYSNKYIRVNRSYCKSTLKHVGKCDINKFNKSQNQTKSFLNNVGNRATSKSRWNYQFSSDHWSQATLSTVSTWMGDRLGTPCDVASHFFIFAKLEE